MRVRWFLDETGGRAFDDVGPAAQSAEESGAQAVQLHPLTEVPNSTATIYSLALGDTALSSIETPGDDDWYRVQLVAGQSYAITLTGTGIHALLDPYLELRDTNGNLVSLDDDGGPDHDSIIRFTATAGGTYYVNARAWEPDTGAYITGDYTLAFNLGPRQDPLDTIDLGTIVPTHTISVYFANTGEVYDGETASRGWNVTEITAAFNALATYEAVADLHFVQTADPGAANFILLLEDLPGNTLGQFDAGGAVGYGMFDPTATGWTTAGLQPGGIGFVTLIHEFGHGLGLAHPHDSGGASETMQGVVDLFDSYGTYDLNQGVFTTMSYNDGWPAGPLGYNFSTTYGSQGAPGALDVALIQQKYGVNPNTNAGDTTYTLTDIDGPGAAYRTIWDVSGVDTMVYNGANAVTIDLRPASLVSEEGGGGWVSYAWPSRGGYTIAAGAIIENAQGGGGADMLHGNDIANRLSGGAGWDTLFGGEGNDILEGGTGSDSLDGGYGADTMTGGIESDRFVIDNAGDVIVDPGANDWATSSVSYVMPGHLAMLTLTGAAISAVGNDDPNTIEGDELDNSLSGGGGDDTITGANGLDTLLGGEGADSLDGGNGEDSIDGGAGADVMMGGNGGDLYIVDNAGDSVQELPGAGLDTVQASITYTLTSNVEILALSGSAAINGAGNELDNVVIGNYGDNVLTGGLGSDTLGGGGGGADTMIGGVGDDFYVLDDPSDVAIENANEGLDTIQTNFSYTLADNFENFSFTVSDGDFNVTGNASANQLWGTQGANTILGLGGDDVLLGYGGDDNLQGGDGDDLLAAFKGADTLIGGLGADTLDGSAGADSMAGGEGNDTYNYDDVGDVIVENSGEGTDTVLAFIGVTALVANVENLELQGAVVTGNGNELANRITGNASNNNINGGLGADTMLGGAGNDTYFVDNPGDIVTESVNNGVDAIFSTVDISALTANVENLTVSGAALLGTGNNLNNIITGNSNNNTLNGGVGEDTLQGGLGNDTYVVNSAGDVVIDTGGNGDTILAFIDIASLNASIENLTLAGSAVAGAGNALNNTIIGNNLNNVLTGGAGNDSLNGSVGADTLNGGLGDDAYLVENAGDVVNEDAGEGTDIIYAFVSIFSLAANVERLTLMPAGGVIDGTGNALDNRVNGNDSANSLSGLAGTDVIQGLGGDDHIYGGAGLDNMFGGAGADTFVYLGITESGLTGAARDVINDFTQGADRIDLSGIDAVDGGGDDAFTLIGAGAFTHVAGQVRYDLIDASGAANDFTLISMDINGDGAADSQITLRGLVSLTSADFVL